MEVYRSRSSSAFNFLWTASTLSKFCQSLSPVFYCRCITLFSPLFYLEKRSKMKNYLECIHIIKGVTVFMTFYYIVFLKMFNFTFSTKETILNANAFDRSINVITKFKLESSLMEFSTLFSCHKS